MKRYVASAIALLFYASTLPPLSYSAPRAGFSSMTTEESPVVDVTAKKYGADPTGVLDSSAAVQAAQVSLVNGSAPVVFFPPGKYLIDNTVVVTHHHTKFRGSGVQNTFIKIGAGKTAFSPPAGSLGRNGIEFSDMDFSSASGTPDAYAFTAPDNTAGVSSSVTLAMKFFRCQFSNLLNVYNPEIENRNIHFTGAVYEDVRFSNAPSNLVALKDKNVLTFNRVEWTGMSQGVPAFQLGGGTADAFGVYFTDARWDVNDNEAIVFRGAAAKVANVQFVNPYFEASCSAGGACNAIRLDNVVLMISFKNLYATDSSRNAVGRNFIGGSSAAFYASPIIIENSQLSGYYNDVDPAMYANGGFGILYSGHTTRLDNNVQNDRTNWTDMLSSAIGGITIGPGGKKITESGSGFAYNLIFGSTAANSCEDNTVSIPGATASNGAISLGVPDSAGSIAKTIFTAWVSSDNNVTVRRCNIGNSAVAPVNDHFLIRYFKD